MEDYRKQYEFWIENEHFDEGTKNELLAIKDNEEEIKERFYKNLEFGTGGLRGIMNAGTNRMNIYTVRAASQGFANYILKQGVENVKKGIVIAYDVRNNSREFAHTAAEVFIANGIKTYLFDDLRPTPVLSFAVKHLGAAAGVVVTASHNPKEYNGYKAYDEDGLALSLSKSKKVLREITKLPDITSVRLLPKGPDGEGLLGVEELGLLHIIGKEIDDIYLEKTLESLIDRDGILKNQDKLKIIYTPIHGSGNKLVRGILEKEGFKNVHIVKEQELPDGNFPTVESPNPEHPEVFELALRDAEEYKADILLGTDPDSDRMAVMVRDEKGNYEMLNGNKTGCVLLYYLLSRKKELKTLPKPAFMVKTVVTTELCRDIAESFGVKVKEVLTGFKFIGEQIKLLHDTGRSSFIMGYEESFGYLMGEYVKDKDAVVSCMVMAEAALYYKMKGMTLLDVVKEMENKYGYRAETSFSYKLEGIEGLKKISNTIQVLRENPEHITKGFELKAVRDYELSTRTEMATGKVSKIRLPKSDVLYFELDEKSWVAIRPSGTEPKIRCYIEMCKDTKKEADRDMQKMVRAMERVAKKYLGIG